MEFISALVSLLILSAPTDALKVDLAGRVYQVRDTGLTTGAWVVEREWDEAAEEEFAEWVHAIGMAREKRAFRLAAGLKNPDVNPLYSPEDDDLRFEADCATFIYAMRTYFAYKTRRPFSFTANKGRRYKANNRPRVFKDFSQYPDFRRLFNGALSAVSSGHFRMHASLEGTDTYPLDVTRESIRPGVVYYDPNGHALMVYRVDEDTGDIFFMDGHPDGTLTRKRFDEKLARGSARFGGGFRGWRHYRIETLDEAAGSFVMVRETNRESAHFSDTAPYRRKLNIDGIKLTYHEWVKARVARNGVYTLPREEFTRRLGGICGDLKERERAVGAAVAADVHLRVHPGKLPSNIYRARGDWQEHSTPALDARLRRNAVELRGFIIDSMDRVQSGDRRVKFDGSAAELRDEYLDIWVEFVASDECAVEYVDTEGTPQRLSLHDLMGRLFDLSFDPYHCPELRWGAPADSAERGTCLDGRSKLSWYAKERRLRNRTFPMLRRSTHAYRGPSRPPRADVVSLLECYVVNEPDFGACHPRRVSARR